MKIITVPHPILRQKAKPITTITKRTLAEIKDMIKLVKEAKDPEGLGLAANQVALLKRVFILIDQDKPNIYINPEIKEKSTKMFSDIYKKSSKRWLEGCLSIPRIWGFVDRPFQITYTYQTIDLNSPNPTLSKPITETVSGMESSYFQHEYDHLNGILFTDHILKQKGQIFRETATGLEPISNLT